MKTPLLCSTLAGGLALTGCNKPTRSDTAAPDSAATTSAPATANPDPTLGQRVDSAAARTGDALASAGRAIENAAEHTGDALRRAGDNMKQEWNDWKLSSGDLEADLAADRPIVRTRTAALPPAGNVEPSQLKRTVQASVTKHAAAIRDLDVEIERETEVVLTGQAATAGEVGRAIGAALDTPGVTKVTSKLKLTR